MVVLKGVDENRIFQTLRTNSSGVLQSTLTLSSGDISIGAVEIKDGTTNARATVASGGLQVYLADANGNLLESELAADGGRHLAVTTIQDVHPDSNNSSTTNLTVGNAYTFSGVGTSTLGVVGLQWNLKTDQNATVYVEQSDDNVNWDISDPFDYRVGHSKGGNTVQAVTAYWRIRVVLVGTTATNYFRLAGVLCPIAEPLPRALSHDERLMTETVVVGQDDRHIWAHTFNGLYTSPRYRLVGHSFNGTLKDTNFWTETVTGSGTIVQTGGEIILNTNDTANSTTKYESVRKGRHVVGYPLLYMGFPRWVTAGTANNVRRLGAYDTNNGFFFQLSGTTFSIGHRKSTVDTLVSDGSFNGDYGINFTPLTTVRYKCFIEYNIFGTYWYIDGKLLHKVEGQNLTTTLTLPITTENYNIGGQDANVEMHNYGAAISREGQIETSPIYKYIGTNGTHVLKYGAGILHSVIVSDNKGTINIYDNTSAAVPQIAFLDTKQGAEPFGDVQFMAPFNTGLTVVNTDDIWCTVIYE